jgi:hypothetical protein
MTPWIAADRSVLAASTSGALELLELGDGFSPRRLSQTALAGRADESIRVVSGLATGVRLRLLTAAKDLALDVTLHRSVAVPTDRSTAPVFSAEVDGGVVEQIEAPVFTRRWLAPDGALAEGGPGRSTVSLHLGGDGITERDVTLWLPHNAEVVVHGAAADAPLAAAPPEHRKRWTHHGSSISHAPETPGPFGPWPQRVARDLGLDLTNLSLSGQAVLDQSVARAIAEREADLITLKLGINVINCDGFSARTFGPAVHGFVETIRDRHPTTPIVLVTAIACPIHEDAPGPTIGGPDGRAMAVPRERNPWDGRLTLADTREVIASVAETRQRADNRLFLLDGLSLFGPADVHHLYDDLHPDHAGNDLIGERFVTMARDPDSALGRALAS